MASTRVRGGGATANNATPQVTLAAAPTAGDLLIAFVDTASASLTATNGFTKLTEAAQSTTRRGAIFWKVADATDALSATVTPASVPSGIWSCFVDQWTNPNGWPAGPVNAENSQAVASTASYTTNTLSPAADVDNVIAAGYCVTSSIRTWSVEAFSGSNVGAVTEVGDAGGAAMATAAISTVTGTYQGSATCNTATAGLDAIAIFKPNAAVTDSFPADLIRGPRHFIRRKR